MGLTQAAYLRWKAVFTVGTFLLLWRVWRLTATRWRTALLMTSIALVCLVDPAISVSRWLQATPITSARFHVVSPTTRFLQNYPPEQNRVYTRVTLYGEYAEEFTLEPRLDSTNLTALFGLQNVAGYEPLIFERYSRALGGETHSRGRIAPMPQRSTIRTRALEPAGTRRGTWRSNR